MIVRMKKAIIMVQAKDSTAVVEKLRSLGVLHVEHIQEPKSKDISIINDGISAIGEALGILSGSVISAGAPLKEAPPISLSPLSIAKHVIDSSKRLDQLREYSRHLEVTIDQYAGWRDFDPEKISSLAGKNIFVRF